MKLSKQKAIKVEKYKDLGIGFQPIIYNQGDAVSATVYANYSDNSMFGLETRKSFEGSCVVYFEEIDISEDYLKTINPKFYGVDSVEDIDLYKLSGRVSELVEKDVKKAEKIALKKAWEKVLDKLDLAYSSLVKIDVDEEFEKLRAFIHYNIDYNQNHYGFSDWRKDWDKIKEPNKIIYHPCKIDVGRNLTNEIKGRYDVVLSIPVNTHLYSTMNHKRLSALESYKITLLNENHIVESNYEHH